MGRISLQVTPALANAIVRTQIVQDFLARYDLKNPLILASDSGIAIKLTHGKLRGKVKISIAAKDNNLILNIRDVKLEGVSLGGNWIEGVLQKVISMLQQRFKTQWIDNQLIISDSQNNLKFIAAGHTNNLITVIIDA